MKINKKIILAIFLFLPFFALAANLNYQPMEEIPIFGAKCDFYDYIVNIYRLGLATVGISAMLMIMIGGYMYATSAGNNAAMEKAKGVITDAIIGLILALMSWLLLYIINPDLVSINKITTSSDCNTGSGGGRGGGGTGEVNRNKAVVACNSSGCSDIEGAVQNNSPGVDPKILKAIMVGGERCNPDYSSDGKGSCGYSQAKPEIRQWCGITDPSFCSKVQNGDPDAIQQDVDCSAKLIKDNSGRCGGLDNINGVASCYNSGRANNCAKTTKNYCGRVESCYNSYGST